MHLRRTLTELYLGVDNVLNHENLLSYAWMPRYQPKAADRNPIGALWQTPVFPNFGIRVLVR